MLKWKPKDHAGGRPAYPVISARDFCTFRGEITLAKMKNSKAPDSLTKEEKVPLDSSWPSTTLVLLNILTHVSVALIQAIDASLSFE